tara:strand:+ start:4296 stop:4937 length:642 start_codon:yes stop_codon:yes gene_type:complete
MSYLSVASWVAEDATTSSVEFLDLDTKDATSLRFELYVCSNSSTSSVHIAEDLRVSHAWAGGPNASAASQHWGGSASISANNNWGYLGNTPTASGNADFYLLQMAPASANRDPNDGGYPTSGSMAGNSIYEGFCINPNGSHPKAVVWQGGYAGRNADNAIGNLATEASKIVQGIGGLRQNDASSAANAAFTGIKFSTPNNFGVGSRIIISKLT